MGERDCMICRGPEGDAALERVQVWEDRLWRLTTSLSSEIPGFSYLEPKRHVPHIEDLDGEEARALGAVLASTAKVLKDVTKAERVYVYVFGGGIAHLHIHLAPHQEGDALNENIIRGEVAAEKLPSGATRLVSKEFPPRPRPELQAVAERIRERLARR